MAPGADLQRTDAVSTCWPRLEVNRSLTTGVQKGRPGQKGTSSGAGGWGGSELASRARRQVTWSEG